MTMRTLIVFWLVVGSAGSTRAQTAPAAAPAEPDYPVVRVGVLSYVQYDAELINRGGFSVFDLTRSYINVNGQL